MSTEPPQPTWTAEQIARLWDGHDLQALLNERSRGLAAGSGTDWGTGGAAAPRVPSISLGGGIPDPATLPRAALLRAAERALAVDDDEPLRYGGAFGSAALREALARRARLEGCDVGAEHFMLANGAAGAIDAVCSALVQPGDVVLCEAPTFMGTIRTFRGHGAEVIGLPMDGEGIDVDAVAAQLTRLRREGRRVPLIYVIANFHNPTGIRMSTARREALVRVAAQHASFVLVDDAYAAIAFDDESVVSPWGLTGGRGVIIAGSFSKSIATGLRVGWIQAEPALLEAIARMRFDMGGSALLHGMLAEFMASGEFDAHVEQMRPLYARKAETLASALMEFAEPYVTLVRPRGGFFLWVRLRDGLSAAGVQQAAAEEGASFPLGRGFYPDRNDPEEHIRLAYSWTALDDLREVATRIGRACERVAAGR